MSKARQFVLLQIAGILFAVVATLIAVKFFAVAEIIARVQQMVVHLGVLGALCYPLLYACCNILLLPAGLLSVGGGFFYGLWWGFLIVFVANVASAIIAFLIARGVGRQWLRRKLRDNSAMEVLEPAMEKKGWKIVLLTQLHPLFPTSLLNYLYGLTPIPFSTCIFWGAIGQAPGLFLYVYVGTLGQLGLNILRGRTHPRVVEYWFWGGGLLVSAAILVFLTRLSLQVLRQVERRRRRSTGYDSGNDLERKHLERIHAL